MRLKNSDKSAVRQKSTAKADLPQKICATCGRPFEWRKKWQRVWDDVKYCSDRCRGARKIAARYG